MGFDLGFERPTCLATLKSSDRTKQSVYGWQYIYIYIYIYMCVCVLFSPVKPESGIIPSEQTNHSTMNI